MDNELRLGRGSNGKPQRMSKPPTKYEPVEIPVDDSPCDSEDLATDSQENSLSQATEDSSWHSGCEDTDAFTDPLEFEYDTVSDRDSDSDEPEAKRPKTDVCSNELHEDTALPALQRTISRLTSAPEFIPNIPWPTSDNVRSYCLWNTPVPYSYN